MEEVLAVLSLLNWPRLLRNIVLAVVAQVVAEVIKTRRELGPV